MGNKLTREHEERLIYQRMKTAYDQQMADEIALRNQEHEQKAAIQLAARRKSIIFEGLITVCCLAAAVEVFAKFKMPVVASSIATTSLFFFGYRFDGAYGTQQESIKKRAEEFLALDRQKFAMVGETIRLADVDERVDLNKCLNKGS